MSSSSASGARNTWSFCWRGILSGMPSTARTGSAQPDPYGEQGELVIYGDATEKKSTVYSRVKCTA